MKFWKLFAICPFWQRNRKTASTAPCSNPYHEPAPPHGAASTPFHGAGTHPAPRRHARAFPQHCARATPWCRAHINPRRRTHPAPPRPSPALLQSCWEPENKKLACTATRSKEVNSSDRAAPWISKRVFCGIQIRRNRLREAGARHPAPQKKDRSKAILFLLAD